jgi:hypothetical protein
VDREYYDDNFGHYNMDDDPEETQGFYKHVQEESVLTTCVICERKVKLRPHYNKCNSCMDAMESGQMY